MLFKVVGSTNVHNCVIHFNRCRKAGRGLHLLQCTCNFASDKSDKAFNNCQAQEKYGFLCALSMVSLARFIDTLFYQNLLCFYKDTEMKILALEVRYHNFQKIVIILTYTH